MKKFCFSQNVPQLLIGMSWGFKFERELERATVSQFLSGLKLLAVA